MRKSLLIVSAVLLAFALAIFLSDAYTSHRYGFHVNEVVGIADSGEPIDWPTGERPMFLRIPILVYALGFCVLSTGAFSLRSRIGQSYHGRICRGTE